MRIGGPEGGGPTGAGGGGPSKRGGMTGNAGGGAIIGGGGIMGAGGGGGADVTKGGADMGCSIGAWDRDDGAVGGGTRLSWRSASWSRFTDTLVPSYNCQSGRSGIWYSGAW